MVQVSDRLLDAAMAVLADDGWDGLSLQSAAERAGLSRVTAWRQAASKDHLVDALLARLAADYRDTLWPILTAQGNGADRLERAFGALCDVAVGTCRCCWPPTPRSTGPAGEPRGRSRSSSH